MRKRKDDHHPKTEYAEMKFWVKSKGSFVREDGSKEKSEAF